MRRLKSKRTANVTTADTYTTLTDYIMQELVNDC